jgi:hypothetical protein
MIDDVHVSRGVLAIRSSHDLGNDTSRFITLDNNDSLYARNGIFSGSGALMYSIYLLVIGFPYLTFISACFRRHADRIELINFIGT